MRTATTSFLDDLHFPGASITLRPGNVLSIIHDDGPSGPCGQCMSITCPHTMIHWYPSEDAYRANRPTHRNGVRTRERVVVVGDWASPGRVSLTVHPEAT